MQLSLASNQTPESELGQLLHEFYESEQKLKEVKETVDELKKQIYEMLSPADDSKTIKAISNGYAVKITRKFMRKFDQAKLAETVEALPDLKKFFKVEFKPVSNVDIENYLKYVSNDQGAKALAWASEYKEYAPLIEVVRLDDVE